MRLSKPKAEEENTNRDINNSSYPARIEFNNVLLFICKYFGLTKTRSC
jgi:hypothetical protein